MESKEKQFAEEELKPVSGGVSPTGRGCLHFSVSLKYLNEDVPRDCAYCRFYKNGLCERIQR